MPFPSARIGCLARGNAKNRGLPALSVNNWRLYPMRNESPQLASRGCSEGWTVSSTWSRYSLRASADRQVAERR